MQKALRCRWDMEEDRPYQGKPDMAKEAEKHARALAAPIPRYRAKLVTLPGGQYEISAVPVDEKTVINARMGFNPLLDSPRRIRTEEEQAQRDEENRKRATKRARQNVRHLVKSLFADHLLTFSYRENIQDRALVAAHWKEFVRLYRIRYPEWKYLAVLEKQERGALHIHCAVHGKQNIKWLLRCWLLAIGQGKEEVNKWLATGEKLGEKSKGAVNVEPPKKRWGGEPGQWKAQKLAGYLTKYIGKEFEEAEKSAKKYWHSKNIEKPKVERFWLRAKTFHEAVLEAHDLIYFRGCTSLSMWGNSEDDVIWITGETRRELVGKTIQGAPEWEFLNDE